MNVTITSQAIVEIPAPHWSSFLQMLAHHHGQRLKLYSDSFITDTKAFPLQSLLWKYAPGFGQGSALSQGAWDCLLAGLCKLRGFSGELIFRQAPLP